PRPGRRAATILIVDDDGNSCVLLQRVLTRAGFAVKTTGHGRDALDYLRGAAVDLVVTDMLMPEMDGIELMQILRSEWPDLPVLAMSGVDEWEKYLGIAMNLGAKAGLRKPIEGEALLQAVNRVLDGRHRAKVAALAD
ncbi:MAG TPA: response regulator, partial [Candidatus Sulfotelmatobacter sp.]|nr:response regulator [Candidatus Sulfotelmatobacter sp.]